MESSRRRNSILDWLIAATLAFAAISGTAGIDLELGPVALRSHSAVRVLAATLVLLAIRWRGGVTPVPLWVTRIALLTAICASIATWFRFLLPTIGGADSYGYVSAGELIARGALIAEAPVAEWLSHPNRMAIVSPLGWAPAPDGSGIVPAYPLGLPLMMALFSIIGGPPAVFVVAPCAAALTLLLVYRLASSWYDAATALLATALVAWNPLLIAYAKQPMSDVPAAMWIALAAAIPVAAYRGDTPRRRAAMSAAGLAIGLGAQMVIQHQLFGSPFATGYGDTNALFSPSHIPTNLAIFAKHGWLVVGPLWILGLLVGLFAARPEPRSRPALIFCAVMVPYLLYLPFDHWETLRYLLPGIVPLTVTVADGLMHFARTPRHHVATAVILCAFITIAVVQSELLLRRSSVWDVVQMEARYPLAGEWVHLNTPPNSVVLANQHSGSLRWYGKRETLRWDFIAPEDLATIVGELESHGAAVYVALEGAEVEMFDSRFAGTIERLQVDHVGRVRNVHFRRLTSRAGNPAPGLPSP
jgi:hypothetical protein